MCIQDRASQGPPGRGTKAPFPAPISSAMVSKPPGTQKSPEWILRDAGDHTEISKDCPLVI